MSQLVYEVKEDRVEMFVPTGRELYFRDLLGLVAKAGSAFVMEERDGKYYVVPLRFVKRFEEAGTRYVISRVER